LALLLLTRRLKPERVYREIDWSLLLLFAGLFIVVRGMEAAVLSPELLAQAQGLHLDQPAMLAAVAAILSNLVSNVPAVLVLVLLRWVIFQLLRSPTGHLYQG
jgi:Na+/H+ antiporter NhaD/arsenite permease-like protein